MICAIPFINESLWKVRLKRRRHRGRWADHDNRLHACPFTAVTPSGAASFQAGRHGVSREFTVNSHEFWITDSTTTKSVTIQISAEFPVS
jgi:hypothetical protein